MGLFDMFTQEIAIDLGTANTLIIHNNKIVIDQPSIVAIERSTGKPIAVGEQAKHMQGKTHEDIKTVRPLKDGVIADFAASEHMIKEFIKKIPGIKGKLFQPALRIVICIPSGITEVEKRAVGLFPYRCDEAVRWIGQIGGVHQRAQGRMREKSD